MAKRPEKKFAWEICGHDKVASFLQAAIANNKVSHAYLFVGPAGVGKKALASLFLKSLFCLSPDQPIPCNDCSNCRQLDRNLHPDVYLVERLIDEETGKWKKDILIRQIQDLKLKLQQTTLLSGYKAALISEAQLVNRNAFSALLKLLEEPTAKTVIILLTDDLEKIPNTIVSRCQRLNFLPVRSELIEAYLARAGAGSEQTKVLARLAHGLPGRALNLLQDDQLQQDWQDNWQSFLRVVQNQSAGNLDHLEEIIDWEKDETVNAIKINRLINNWQTILRDLLLLSQNSQYYAGSVDYGNDFSALSGQFGFSRIKKAVAQLARAKDLLQQNISTKIILENLIINL